MVPQKYPPDPKLGIWVNKQREEFKFRMEGKRSSMTDEKVAALELVGFEWYVTRSMCFLVVCCCYVTAVT